MSKKPLVPFFMVPAYWGAKGKFRDRAKAEYELEGYDLEVVLAKIDLEDSDREKALTTKLLDIDKKYGKISEREYETRYSKATKTEKDHMIDLNYLSYKYKDISEKEYHKNAATILGEPWVDIMNFGVDPSNAARGTMELDWNDIFIEHIAKSGFVAPTPEEAVDMWLVDVCKNLALEELKDYMTDDEIEDFNEHVRNKKKKTLDGKTERY